MGGWLQLSSLPPSFSIYQFHRGEPDQCCALRGRTVQGGRQTIPKAVPRVVRAGKREHRSLGSPERMPESAQRVKEGFLEEATPELGPEDGGS